MHTVLFFVDEMSHGLPIPGKRLHRNPAYRQYNLSQKSLEPPSGGFLVAHCGKTVPSPLAEALVRANQPVLC